jgi:glutamate/aspartate transport system substrate-binding protein
MKFTAFIVALAAAAGSAAAVGQTTDTLKKLKSTGEITVGVREAAGALSYFVGDGVYAGYHVEICQRIIANLEKTVGRKLEVKYQTVTGQNRIPLLQNGTIDMECGSTTNNATRQNEVSFLYTTFVEEVRMAVKGSSGITSVAQLSGKTITVPAGTTAVQHVRKHKRATGVQFKEVFGKDMPECFILLDSGRADAWVLDGAILAANIATARNPADFKIVGEVFSVEPIAIMVRKDDAPFKKVGDDTLRGLAKSGELAKLWDKWFLQPIPPKNIRIGYAISANTREAWKNLNTKPMEEYVLK